MNRQLHDADFPLSLVGTVIFANNDPVPVYVGPDVETAETLYRLVTIGYDTSAAVARVLAGNGPALNVASYNAIGRQVVDMFVNPQAELPLPEAPAPVENGGWTLDRPVNPS